ncbi:MAG: hypothetical protein O7B30_06995 [Thaumarchaeota archaeon]|nr:hypothetical protein [Nitrososphaerota archaeon]
MQTYHSWLLAEEKVIHEASKIAVNGEDGFLGGLTNRRLILIKGEKLLEFSLGGIKSAKWENLNRSLIRSKKQVLAISGSTHEVRLDGKKEDLDQLAFYIGRLVSKDSSAIDEDVAEELNADYDDTDLSELDLELESERTDWSEL